MLKLKNQLQRQLNLFSAMERETISKNRVSPKDVRSRGNLARIEYTLFAALCLFSAIGANAQTATTDPGVDINGVTWATRNVGMPGTFVASPEDPGMLYRAGSRVGWSSTDPMVSSNGDTEWSCDPVNPRTEGPCPPGWHVPSEDDVIRSLQAKDVQATITAQEEPPGFWVGGQADRIFMPRLHNGMREGCYVDNERTVAAPGNFTGDWFSFRAFYLHTGPNANWSFREVFDIYTREVGIQQHKRNGAYMVRCVKDAQ